MPLSEELWQANQDLIKACFNSKFISALESGSEYDPIQPELILNYSGQDIFILETLAKAYSISASKTADWDSFCFLQRIVSALIDQIQARREQALQKDLSSGQHRPERITQRYTHFLTSIAWEKNLGVILSATLPYFKWQLILSRYLLAHYHSSTPSSHLQIFHESPETAAAVVDRLEKLFNQQAVTQESRYSVYRQSLLCLKYFLDDAMFDQKIVPQETFKTVAQGNWQTILKDSSWNFLGE